MEAVTSQDETTASEQTSVSGVSSSTIIYVLIVGVLTAAATVAIMVGSRKLSAKYKYLSKQEIKDFFKGGNGENNYDELLGEIQSFSGPYNKE